MVASSVFLKIQVNLQTVVYTFLCGYCLKCTKKRRKYLLYKLEKDGKIKLIKDVAISHQKN